MSIDARGISFNDFPGYRAGNHQVIANGALGAGQLVAFEVMAFSMATAIGTTNGLF